MTSFECIRYRFTWPTSTETADKVRIQLFREQRPTSYDQEQEKDEAIELLSDQDFSLASLSVESHTESNIVHDLVDDNHETEESDESDEEGTDWLNEPGESIRGAVFTLVSSNSNGMSTTELDTRERTASVKGETFVESDEEECEPVIGRRPGSNLAALGNLRAKLNIAVKRQGEEQPDRLSLMKARATALDNLENYLDSVSPDSQEKRKDSTDEPGAPILASENGVDKESDAANDMPSRERESVELSPANPISDERKGPKKPTRKSRLLTSFSISPKSDEGTLAGGGHTEVAGGDSSSPRTHSSNIFKDAVSMRKLFRPRGGGNMREFRTTPGQSRRKSIEGSQQDGPDVTSGSIVAEETAGRSSRSASSAENSQSVPALRKSQPQGGLHSAETSQPIPAKRRSHPQRSLHSADASQPVPAKRRSQPHSKAPANSEALRRESEPSECPPPSLRQATSQGRQSRRVSHSRSLRHGEQGPVSMRRRISNVLSKGVTDSASRKSERHLMTSDQDEFAVPLRPRKSMASKVPSSPLTPATKSRKRTVFPLTLE